MQVAIDAPGAQPAANGGLDRERNRQPVPHLPRPGGIPVGQDPEDKHQQADRDRDGCLVTQDHPPGRIPARTTALCPSPRQARSVPSIPPDTTSSLLPRSSPRICLSSSDARELTELLRGPDDWLAAGCYELPSWRELDKDASVT
jgi:hypothetical protein